MLLSELAASKKGTYIGVRPDKESSEKLKDLLALTPNPTESKDLHCTVIYSRKWFKYDPTIAQLPLAATAKKYRFFGEGGERCLVLELDSESLHNFHNTVMGRYKATYDFDQYIPHVTLSYEIPEDFDISKLPDPKTIGTISFDTVYDEELDP